jgi:hypothetical protein
MEEGMPRWENLGEMTIKKAPERLFRVKRTEMSALKLRQTGFQSLQL